ncbi:MAG: hypothetical protein WKF96_03770 [Solirubrobacteraceae bacterium]
MASQLFRFAQIEVPWPFGPDDGRYVVRRHAGEQPEHVLVLATLGAPQRRLLRGKRAKNAEPEPDPTPVPTGRATIIPAAPLETEKDAARWLKDADGETEIEAALVVLNRALHAHRVALADPHAREVGRDDALVARIGFGVGEQVAEGRWAEALTLPVPQDRRQRRVAALRPQERVAALLSGRDVALACELLVLRARADLDAGRQREAALQLRVALDTALAELPAWAERGDLPARIKELAGFVDPAAAVAATALERGLDVDEAEEIERILGRLEAALRARTAAGFA